MATAKSTTDKRTRNTLVRGWSWDLCKALPNVKVGARVDAKLTEQEYIDLLFNAARQWPTWTFTVDQENSFQMHCGEERLGYVRKEWVSRSGNHLIGLNGDRVARAMSRRSNFTSPDAAAVLRKIKEFIYPKTLAEKIENAVNEAYTHAYHAVNEVTATLSEVRAAINSAAIEFALSPQGRTAFMEYEAKFGTGRDTAAALVKIDEVKAQNAAAQALRNQCGNGVAVLYRVPYGWLVKYKEETSQYEDDGLPPVFANVHLLKMTQEEVVVADVGMKINGNVFLVFPIEEATQAV